MCPREETKNQNQPQLDYPPMPQGSVQGAGVQPPTVALSQTLIAESTNTQSYQQANDSYNLVQSLSGLAPSALNLQQALSASDSSAWNPQQALTANDLLVWDSQQAVAANDPLALNLQQTLPVAQDATARGQSSLAAQALRPHAQQSGAQLMFNCYEPEISDQFDMVDAERWVDALVNTEVPDMFADAMLPNSSFSNAVESAMPPSETTSLPPNQRCSVGRGLETLKPAFERMYGITTADEAQNLVIRTLKEKRSIVNFSPDQNAKSSVIVSGNLYVAELYGKRWVDRGAWTGSRKGGKTGAMIYRQLAPGKTRGTTFAQTTRIDESNCEQYLGLSALEIFQRTGMQVVLFAKTYVSGVHGGDFADPNGMVKRTFKVVLDSSSGFVPLGLKREFMVISYYTLRDLAGHLEEVGQVNRLV